MFFGFLFLTIIFQITAIIFVNTKIYGPFKVITIYSLLFETLRYFYIDAGISTFDVTSEEIRTTLVLMIIFTSTISLMALIIEKNFMPKEQIKSGLIHDDRDKKLADLFFYISMISIIFVLFYRYFNYGFIIQQDFLLDVWAGLYILKIPMLFSVVSLIMNIELKRYKYSLIGILQLLLIVSIDGERSPLFFFAVSIGVYLLFVKRISIAYPLIFIFFAPFIFQFLTFRRFFDLSSLEILTSMQYLLNWESFIAFIQQSYGRYYALEATYLMFESSNGLAGQFNSGKYLIYNLFAFFAPDNYDISLSRIVCQSIDFQRWEEHVSCSAYYPALMFFDSGFIGLFLSLFSLIFLFYFWTKGAYSNYLIYYAVFLLIFPRLITTMSFTLASIFELGYYGLYFLFIFLISKINFFKPDSSRLNVNTSISKK